MARFALAAMCNCERVNLLFHIASLAILRISQRAAREATMIERGESD